VKIGLIFSMPFFHKYQTTAKSVSVLFENLGVTLITVAGRSRIIYPYGLTMG